MRDSVEFIWAGLVIIAILAFSFLVMWGMGQGAQNYLEAKGYQIETFEQGVAIGSCYISKDRQRYNFTAIKDGQVVKGYLCYGGITEAAIHLEEQ